MAGLAGDSSGDTFDDYCTFTASPGSNEQKPVNCVTYSAAKEYCASLGKTLPTEAQFEYVASDRRSSLYVWGDDDRVSCGDAVLGHAGWGIFAMSGTNCKPAAPPGGALEVMTHARDAARIGEDQVFDLVGNVAEFVRDRFSYQSEPCWSHGGVYVDPVCKQPSTGRPRFSLVARGSAWFGVPAQATAASRLAHNDSAGPDFGFRCARDTR